MEPKETAHTSNGNRPKNTQVIQIDLDEFVRLKDAYIVGLGSIENAAHDLSRNFIRHTNELINNGNISALDLLTLANPLAENGAPTARRAPTPGPKTDGIKKPKRPHDKNAPTKAMTPFFLFMQTMRPIIQREMGPDYKSKDVELEGQHRWKNISKPEKDAVQYKYACNRAAYYEKMKAYKAGLPIPEISEEQAEKLYEEQQRAGFVPKPIPTTLAPVEPNPASDSSDASSEEDEKSPTPTKAPSPPKSPRASKRRKTNKESAEHATPVKAPHKEVEKYKHTTETPTTERATRPADKKKEKKERVSKKKDDKESAVSVQVPPPVAVIAESSQPKSTPVSQEASKKEKKSRKKRKNDEVEG
ncbi:MAG: hypothetical protein MMC33_000185 [Icmadophila ericetorum]|nr:hypothetical protein [Icmadophila ericetorum]